MYKTSPLFSDELYIKLQFRYLMHYSLNLRNPQTFQEKLQWLKLYDRKPVYSQMVDKYESKKFIEARVGKSYVIPTIGIYDNVNQINFDKLPKAYIVKTTHDSASYIIVKDNKQADRKHIKSFFSKRLKRTYYYSEREWPYKNVKPRIIIEELLSDGSEELRDYKFYCFNGEPKFFYITSNRNGIGGLKEDFFDVDGTLMELNQKGYYNNPQIPQLPKNLSKMLNFSKKLAENTYHLRVDFYEVSGKLYCGELTFFDGGGFCSFVPEKYNKIFGDWIKLPHNQ